jgi:ferric-dicitrate binding protein FerR (iron transport regulator)
MNAPNPHTRVRVTLDDALRIPTPPPLPDALPPPRRVWPSVVALVAIVAGFAVSLAALQAMRPEPPPHAGLVGRVL